jgi:dihydroxyacetone kinase-like predicted kinase
VARTVPDAIEGPVLRDWADRAVRALNVHREELDALNVFPVADSDTGTNLYLTLREALDAVSRVGARDEEAARDFARGALVGARGNSGVIVSQYLGALLRSLPAGSVTADGLVAALRQAADAAYRAVAHPVEGTVLSVARAVSDGAAVANTLGAQPVGVLEAAVDAGYVALGRTPVQLEVLRVAGVLDAGAWGLLLVLDALTDALHREAGVGHVRPTPAMPTRQPCAVEGLVGGEFEVMYVVTDDGLGTEGEVDDALRAALSAVGDSVAVVGGDGLWQAHVHTDTPLLAVESAAVAGEAATQIRVRHLASQSGVHGAHRPPLGLVTVTGAPALAADLARAGAVVVLVPSGTVAGSELERAVDDTGASTVLLLAVDGLAHAPAGRSVRVVDGLSEAQVVAGAATLASLDPQLGDERLAEEVLAAVRSVRTAEVDVGPGQDAEQAERVTRELLAEPCALLTVLPSVSTPEAVVQRVVAVAAECGVEAVVLPTGAAGVQVVLGAE